METREENLKKINDQLEQLSDEELEKIAGGWGADLPHNPINNKKEMPPCTNNNVLLQAE